MRYASFFALRCLFGDNQTNARSPILHPMNLMWPIIDAAASDAKNHKQMRGAKEPLRCFFMATKNLA